MGQRSQDASERAGGSRSAGEFLPVRNRPSARSAYRRARRTDAPPCTRRSRGCSPKPRRAETWCRRTVRKQLQYSLGNGTLATAFDQRANNTALAGAIINVNATLAELHGASRIGEVLTDAPTPATWSDNCECVPAAPTKILTLQTAAASPEYGCPRVCTVQTGRVSPPPSPASRR